MFLTFLAAICFAFIQGVFPLQWEDPMMAHSNITACKNDDVILPWNVLTDPGETIGDINWRYRGDHSQEIVAFLVRGNFQVMPAFAHRVERYPNTTAGLVLKDALPGDSGNYTVEIVQGQGQDAASMIGEASVTVSEPPVLSEHGLQLVQEPNAVRNREGHFAVQLTCGSLISVGNPSVADGIEFELPSGLVLRPDGQYVDSEGTKFQVTLPNPVEGGPYHCRLGSWHPAAACLSQNATDAFYSVKYIVAGEARQTVVEAGQDDLQKEIAILKQESHNLVHSFQQLQTTLDQYRSERNLTADQVAFNAMLTNNQTVTDHETVILSNVQLNQGSYYNPQTGVFTVPYDGTYLFMLTVGAATFNGSARLYIVADSTVIGYAYVNYGVTGSGHSVVHLTKGQRVWVRSNGDGNLSGAATAFSGVLMRMDSSV